MVKFERLKVIPKLYMMYLPHDDDHTSMSV